MGFSLEQIKVLLKETNQETLKELLEKRLLESKKSLSNLSHQVQAIQSILTSLSEGKELTPQERNQVMESILEISLNHLKRRGIVNDQNIFGGLAQEVAQLSPELEKILPEIQALTQYAQKNDIFLGPGRATSLGSLILYAQGYSPFNPLDFGLIPELFAQAKHLWLDVEYSRYREVGAICDQISEKSDIEVMAFRKPILDIFREMQNQIGIVHFDQFSDNDPIVLSAPKKLGLRGLFGPEWNPNFDAFRLMSEQFQKEHDWNLEALQDWYNRNEILGIEDFLNIGVLQDYDRKAFLTYRQTSCPENLPELKKSYGHLLFREDWIKIFIRLTGASVKEACLTLDALNKKTLNSESSLMDQIKDEKIKSLLLSRAESLDCKSHALSWWWFYKRTAIYKSLWKDQYLKVIDEWEQTNNLIWQEFGYKRQDGSLFLKA